MYAWFDSASNPWLSSDVQEWDGGLPRLGEMVTFSLAARDSNPEDYWWISQESYCGADEHYHLGSRAYGSAPVSEKDAVVFCNLMKAAMSLNEDLNPELESDPSWDAQMGILGLAREILHDALREQREREEEAPCEG